MRKLTSESEQHQQRITKNSVDRLLKEERVNVRVLETQDHWFGVTYREDKESVKNAFARLISNGVYSEMLWK